MTALQVFYAKPLIAFGRHGEKIVTLDLSGATDPFTVLTRMRGDDTPGDALAKRS